MLDTAAAVVPFVPGGAGSAIKAVRAADKAIDAAKSTSPVGIVVKHGDDIKTAKRVEGIYEFADATAKGRVYIGQSSRIGERLTQHTRAGKLETGTSVTVRRVEGGKTVRELAEQRRIDQLGGTVN